MRCFVAIQLVAGLRAALGAALGPQREDSSGVRWTNADQYHLTLKFLGDVGPEELISICDIVRGAAEQIQPFTLTLDEFGAFPSVRRPRVLWCGVHDETAGCARWVAYAEPRFEELGFEFEERPFHAHITVARSTSDGGARRLAQLLGQISAPAPEAMQVEQLVLFESRLEPAGAVHKPLFTVALSGKSDLQPELV